MKDLIVFAENREEMVASQLQMVDWAVMKLEDAKNELIEVSANLKLAEQGKQKTSGWKRQEEKAIQRVFYYEKIHAALAAGYVIVPNFPVDIFAVRTGREYPEQMWEMDNSWRSDKLDRTQTGDILPLGVGENVSDTPKVKNNFSHHSGGEEGKVWYTHFADMWREVDFPIKPVKPIVMERTSKALQLKVFDDLGILPGRPQKRNRLAPVSNAISVPRGIDPMVIGRVKFPMGAGKERVVSFLVAWWLKASDLEV